MTARMSALLLRKHLGGLRGWLHETKEPHFQPSPPCGVDATLTMATRGWTKKPAETPSPAGPSPRRLASRPAKLISVVSCATTIRRPDAAAVARPKASLEAI